MFQEYVGRLITLEVKLNNQNVDMPNMFMAAVLMEKSNLSEMEKGNVLATSNVEDVQNILKKMLREVD